jgi:4-hydroxyphenylpyruvate dioxygenase
MELRLPAIKGIGGAPLYLIDRFEDGVRSTTSTSSSSRASTAHPVGHGLHLIDHLTHNVYRGRMAFWGGFYEKLFNFREIRYFDIQGEYTGLTSGDDGARRQDPHPAERGVFGKGAGRSRSS